MAAEMFDRTAQNVGNIVLLEHVNFRVPDQQLATAFYVTGLGFTRDPYLMVGLDNMWINLGRSQFHLRISTRSRDGCARRKSGSPARSTRIASRVRTRT